MIQSEAFRCKEITEKLLDFSRIGQSRRQTTDLVELVHDVTEMLRHLGKYQHKEICLKSHGPVIAPVNPQQFKQVVLNLLTNALDSIDADGTVRVKIGRRRRICGIGCRRQRLRNAARGPGARFRALLHPQTRGPRNRFGAIDQLSDHCRPRRRDYGGETGTRPRGHISRPPAAAPGKGELPSATRRITDSSCCSPTTRSRSRLMRLELPRMGHDATVCSDGLTAVAALERHSYDCLLVDLDMPGLSGIEVIARAKELSCDTEAIVLTGKSSLETAVAASARASLTTSPNPAGWPSCSDCCTASPRKAN